ncbi:MAG TPA: DUF4177 domain-containing protein [Rhodanobacteraceae bacterium]|nr:DUF4177 domain-containing protein [Rhodanobacteraceae bacterium]
MSTQWEYKVVKLKPKKPAFFRISPMPDEAEATDILNREGARGWELVSAVSEAPTRPPHLFFKRPR